MQKFGGNNYKFKLRTMKKYLLLLIAPFLFTSCIEDDLVELTDQGSPFLVAGGGTEKELFFNAFTNVKKIPMFDIHRNVPSNAALNTPTTVKLTAARDILEAFNEEHDETYEWLPSEIFTFVNEPGITFQGDDVILNYSAGDFAKEIAINLDGSKWDLAHKYALAYRITDPGNNKIATGNDYFITLISAKNQWDGVYHYTTSSNNTLLPDQDTEVELHTVSPTKVKLYPGLLGYYSNEVWYIIDPETMGVTVEMNTLLPIATDASSHYDPETKTFNLKWTSNGGARIFEETMTFIKDR
jgi:hypothetical protein